MEAMRAGAGVAVSDCDTQRAMLRRATMAKMTTTIGRMQVTE
jgi:hypothetical protein